MAKKKTIIVCSECLRASCVQGTLLCDNYKEAGTIEKTRTELTELDLESSDYWDNG